MPKLPRIRLRSILPWILIFHPRGPFKKMGPWIALMLCIAALPFLLVPAARDRVTDILSTPSHRPSSSQQAGGAPVDFDPLALTGVWSVGRPDIERAEWSWERGKRMAADIWEAQLPGEGRYQSFYCGCTITRTGPSSGKVDLPSCNYESLGDTKRAQRLEWEHIMPASTFGAHRACWTQGLPACRKDDGTMEAGRACCERADPLYQMMSNDPVNLTPAIGEVNGRRSNLPFGALRAGSGDGFGAQCGMRIDHASNAAEPPASRRGDVARIYAYMSRAYGIPIPKQDADLYTQWMSQDPISQDEITINTAIAKTGQRPNPLVLSPGQ